jgi:predicted Zn-dependent peptidase
LDHFIFTLSNGVRVVFKPALSDSAHACVLVNAGSRDELPGKAGLAHFIEHMLFKRTERRSTAQILNRLELVGADLNAYTTKEYTCIHASFLRPYLERSLDLFEDLLFHSVFPEEEIEKEKGVIIDELHSYQDQPEDAIFDDYEALLFGDHPLGKNILGDPETVNALQRNDLLLFTNELYGASSVIIGISGNYTERKIRTACEKFFGSIRQAGGIPKRIAAPVLSPDWREVKKPVSQAHCVSGGLAYDLHHPNRIALLLLNNLLGGPGMSSRLNLEVREKQGIAYTIESNYSPLSDTGIFSIYLGTDPEKIGRAMKIVYRELKKLREIRLGPLQLHQAKQRFIGQIALGEENRMGLAISLAKSIMDYKHADTLAEVVQKVNAVSGNQLLEVANDIFDPHRFTTLLFVPEDGTQGENV